MSSAMDRTSEPEPLDDVTVSGALGPQKVESVEEANEKPAPSAAAFTVPDGGLEAWLVVAGGWLVLFSTFGYINAFGVYQAFYVGALGRSNSAISWIGSFQLWLQFTMGLIVGKLFDEGHGRLLLRVGSVIYLLALFMTSLCKTYWQVFLAQGVAGGIGLGIMFLPAIGVIPHWFKRRRALATGIVVSGSSVGGIVFPIMLNKLFNKHGVGYAWGVRASAFLVLGCLIIANLLIKPRIPGRKHRPAHMQFPDPDFKAILSHRAYWLVIVGGFLIMWGLFFPFFYIQVFAESHGIDPNLSFYLLSILNAASVFGRVLPNFIADVYGVFNLLILAGTGSGIVMFAWLGATDKAGVICIAIFYGFFSGGYVSLMPGVFASLSSHVGEVGLRMGFAWAIMALAALSGTPIDGALLGPTNTFWKPTVFSGTVILAGSFFLLLGRSLHAKTVTSWKI